MKKWMVVAAVAVAIVAVFLVARSGRTPAPPPPAPAAPMGGQAGPATGEVSPHGGPAPGAEGAPGQNPHGAPPAAPSVAERQVLANINGYQVTLPRLAAYAACVKEIRLAGEKDPALMARFRAAKPPPYQQAELAAWLEAIEPLKAILDRHGFTGMDLILMPQAVLQGQVAYNQEKAGQPVPPGETNPSSLAAHRAEPARMAELTAAFAADLRVIDGR